MVTFENLTEKFTENALDHIGVMREFVKINNYITNIK